MKPLKRNRLAEWIATGLGAGYGPIAPGTWGSAEACILAGFIQISFPANSWTILLVLTLLATVIGTWAGDLTAKATGRKDPGLVVIDEIAGQWLTLLFVPITVETLIAGFLLFRVLDILKPFPARQSESLSGGLGIMVDDLVSGLYAGLLVLGLTLLLPLPWF